MTTYYKAWIVLNDKGYPVCYNKNKSCLPHLFFTRDHARAYCKYTKFRFVRAEFSVHWDHFQKA